jgi:hypothetical protein
MNTLQQGSSRKRQSTNLLEFQKAAKLYMGYSCYFLKDVITVVLQDPVLILRMKVDSTTVTRIGIANISTRDKCSLQNHMARITQDFPHNVKKIASIFPEDTEKDMIFIKADSKGTTLYKKGSVHDMNELARVSQCRLAIQLTGFKVTKDGDGSLMLRAIQVKELSVVNKEDREECLFSSDEDIATADTQLL